MLHFLRAANCMFYARCSGLKWGRSRGGLANLLDRKGLQLPFEQGGFGVQMIALGSDPDQLKRIVQCTSSGDAV